ncbi:NAD(P)(+) transhydrogenase (Re/Si-specific) subunit beta [Acetobacter indonesiensis]|jgi:NAD(P) transhydrogenase subunit beta|uniref:NAD(P)(+) transhydrogenase (Re/Si-specific) subunit beta n=1 Tax=Acetobacter indonesiensis TaxID=104101 RepID=UPI000A3CED0F|nr:NAD(P)(+) transhydrogenase (Re/Si-specific) subunit beta [Acetobacter indonesiensis]MCI1437454.1 NAD(P)(+) transhydrogenase (Re/Si-specific) subunit beta [Acetobacter indonesiensis]MCI1545892.1 NAD(P)(+) transhydrogenase (Re/Si-specific) subunit beta [Acetobacter indonesiensis]MCI1765093.1 NAD(P)(+) transhydrogenase (Re/Si-specific) subunit beta [Acetobacter indonesiensis]OUI96108.1 NAD(P) transhydrogenase subunit beta [Acetobacter indonesiensis]
MFVEYIVGFSGLIASALFIYGLKAMSSPVTAVSGIVTAGYGMIFVVAATFLNLLNVSDAVRPHLLVNIGLGVLALILGGAWAGLRGRSVQMTAMPQMVALFNGMGGGSAACLAAVELLSDQPTSPLHLSITVIGALIGCISLTGSIIAWAKLDGRMKKPVRFKGQRLFNGLLFLASVILGAAAILYYGTPTGAPLRDLFFLAALLFGVCMTLPIGGADMPVVISLYNAFTGLAVGLEGYVMGNPALMIAGMVVGSAGTLLTVLMAKAMNRSLTNVLFSNFGETSSASAEGPQGEMKSAEPSDAATTMRYASSVIIVPGYGLAVAQAQQKLYEFVKILVANGVDVKFAIHPVAGRMPGHMNVLLAEAGVPYDMIYDMDDINDSFASTDVALIIGANDVVNPSARTDKSSPIYGMPILNADKAREVFVIKRGQGVGYSGVENPLFFQKNTTMVYGDAQAVLSKMVEAVKALGTN